MLWRPWYESNIIGPHAPITRDPAWLNTLSSGYRPQERLRSKSHGKDVPTRGGLILEVLLETRSWYSEDTEDRVSVVAISTTYM